MKQTEANCREALLLKKKTPILQLTCNRVALRERVSLVIPQAHTNGHMIPHTALRIDAAQPGARILTLAADARPVQRTVIVDGTFGTAVWRGAEHVG